MFNKIKKVFYGARVVGFVKEQENDLVCIRFADGEEPDQEIMHKEEWEGMKTDKPVEGVELEGQFTKATSALQNRLIGLFNDWNIRWTDLHSFRDFVQKIWDEAKLGLYCALFGKDDFDAIKFSDMEAELERHGIEIKFKNEKGEVTELSPLAEALREAYQKSGVKFNNINQSNAVAHNQYLAALEYAIQQLVEKKVGVPYYAARLADLTTFYERLKADRKGVEKEKPERSRDKD